MQLQYLINQGNPGLAFQVCGRQKLGALVKQHQESKNEKADQ
jgi:hypothetical protein